MAADASRVDVLMIGTGEVRTDLQEFEAGQPAACQPLIGLMSPHLLEFVQYTTGYGANSSKTDKAAGVVALAMFDLRKRGVVGDMHLAGSNGRKLPEVRSHMQVSHAAGGRRSLAFSKYCDAPQHTLAGILVALSALSCVLFTAAYSLQKHMRVSTCAMIPEVFAESNWRDLPCLWVRPDGVDLPWG